MTFSVFDLKIDNELEFGGGITAGHVLSINADGTTEWVEPQGGGGLAVDFTGLPSEVFFGNVYSFTASTSRDISTFEVIQNTPVGVTTANPRFTNSNNNQLVISSLGTFSVSLLQGDIEGQTGGLETKEFFSTEKENEIYLVSSNGGVANIHNQFVNPIFSVAPVGNMGITTYSSPVVFDDLGRFYTTGLLNGGFNTRRYLKDGTLSLSINFSLSNTHIIIVDKLYNIFVVGGPGTSNPSTLRKYNELGELLWSLTHATIRALQVDNLGNVYMGNSVGVVNKYDTDGNFLLSFNTTLEPTPMVDNSNANIPAQIRYIGITSNYDVVTAGKSRRFKKWDSSGNLIYTSDESLPANQLQINAGALDSLDNIYFATVNSGGSMKKFNGSDGSLLFNSAFSLNEAYNIDIDIEDNFYLSMNGGLVNYPQIRKFDSNGVYLGFQFVGAPGGFGIACFPPTKQAFKPLPE